MVFIAPRTTPCRFRSVSSVSVKSRSSLGLSFRTRCFVSCVWGLPGGAASSSGVVLREAPPRAPLVLREVPKRDDWAEMSSDEEVACERR